MEMKKEIEEEEKVSKHKKEVSFGDLYKEAKEIVDEAKDLEKKTVIFVNESRNFFEHLFSCCNSKKDVVENEESSEKK